MRKFRVVVDGAKYEVEIEEVGCGYSAPAVVAAPAPAPVVAAPVAAAPAVEEKPAPAAAEIPQGGVEVKAPMPGTLVKIVAATGTQVKKGQPIVVLEAMKMENDIAAPVDGTVTIVGTVGAIVESGAVLAVIK